MNTYARTQQKLVKIAWRNSIMSGRQVTIVKKMGRYASLHKSNLDTYATAISFRSTIILN